MNETFVERLAAMAKEVGIEVLNPPSLVGMSGVEHTFSLLVASGNNHCAVDVYDSMEEKDILRTYLKKFDTATSCYVVSLSGATSESVTRLAAQYQMKCFSFEDIETLQDEKRSFERSYWKPMSSFPEVLMRYTSSDCATCWAFGALVQTAV